MKRGGKVGNPGRIQTSSRLPPQWNAPSVFLKRRGVSIQTSGRFKKTSGFPQILKDECHLPWREKSLAPAVSRFCQGLGERSIQTDPMSQSVQPWTDWLIGSVWMSQSVQGWTGCEIRSVCFCQLALVIRAYTPFFFFFFHVLKFFNHDIKILRINEINNILWYFISCVFIPLSTSP